MKALPVLLAFVFAACLLSGCVERKISILSDPPGAKAYVDGDYVGETPIAVPFDHYGTREIEVRKTGFWAQSRIVPIRGPLYETFPIDFLSEVVYPGNLVDDHRVVFELEPVGSLKPDERAALIERAEHYKGSAKEIKKDATPEEARNLAQPEGGEAPE